MKKALIAVCRFFAWHEKAFMYYYSRKTYRGLPRSWEVGASLYRNLGNGFGVYKSLVMAFTGHWVIKRNYE